MHLPILYRMPPLDSTPPTRGSMSSTTQTSESPLPVDSFLTVDSQGIKRWKNEKGELHRIDGPALIYVSGVKEWYVNGKRHRKDGPAVEGLDGEEIWFQDGLRHRINGPAQISARYSLKGSGRIGQDQWWYVEGKLHREDGPAVLYANGDYKWFLNDRIHRADGPALSRYNPDTNSQNEKFYYEGVLMTPAEFIQKVRKGVQNLTKNLSAPAPIHNPPQWLMARKKLQNEQDQKTALSNHEIFQRKLMMLRKLRGIQIIIPPVKKDEPIRTVITATDSPIVKIENDLATCYYDPKTQSYHREDGPAIVWKTGLQEWHHQGKLHSKSGPALILESGEKLYFWHGVAVDPFRHTRLKNGLEILTDEEEESTKGIVRSPYTDGTLDEDVQQTLKDQIPNDPIETTAKNMATATLIPPYTTSGSTAHVPTITTTFEVAKPAEKTKTSKNKLKQWPDEPDALIAWETIYAPLKEILEKGYAPIRRNSTTKFEYEGYDLSKTDKRNGPPLPIRLSEKYLAYEKEKHKRTLMDVVMQLCYLQGCEAGRRMAYQEQTPTRELHQTLEVYRRKLADLRYKLAKSMAIISVRESCPNLSTQEFNLKVQEKVEASRKARLVEIRKDLLRDSSRCAFKPKQRKKHKLSDLISIASSLDPEIVKREDWHQILKDAGISPTEWNTFAKKKHFTQFVS